MRVAILDYGTGNLHSIGKAIAATGARITIDADPIRCLEADLLVLPGVGSFPQAAAQVAPARDALRDALRAGLPALGICLGMQLLFGGSDEGPGAGLALLDGRVERLRARRVPQMGWNSLDEVRDPLLQRARLGLAYFANGYVCRPRDTATVTAWSSHETDRFPAMVRVHRTVGVQFHPEKSSDAGLAFLRLLVEEVSS